MAVSSPLAAYMFFLGASCLQCSATLCNARSDAAANEKLGDLGMSLLQSSIESVRQEPAEEEDTTYDGQVAVTFGGVVETERTAELNGHPILYYQRPIWMKYERCTGSSEQDCTDCTATDGEDCFEGSKAREGSAHVSNLRVAVHTTSFDWTRFRVKIHLKCSQSSVSLSIILSDIRYGKARIYWDSTELTVMPGRSGQYRTFPVENTGGDAPSASYIYRDTITISPVGTGHELTFEFIPEVTRPAGEEALADFIRPELIMDETFATCEDNKVCLKTLGESGDAGKTLRGSNPLQKVCLDKDWDVLEASASNPEIEGLTADEAQACYEWRQCLRSVSSDDYSHEDKLKLLIEAGGVSTPSAALLSANGSKKRALRVQSNKSDNDLCMNPETEDVESWECDCWTEMQGRCDSIKDTVADYSLGACLQAQFCLYDGVCDFWVEDNCESDTTKAHIEALSASGSLAQSAARKALSPSASLEQSAAHKALSPSSASLAQQSAADKAALAKRVDAREKRYEGLVDQADQNMDETLALKQCT